MGDAVGVLSFAHGQTKADQLHREYCELIHDSLNRVKLWTANRERLYQICEWLDITREQAVKDIEAVGAVRALERKARICTKEASQIRQSFPGMFVVDSIAI